MKSLIRFLIFALFSSTTGCNQREEFVPVYNVPAEFEPIMEAFQAEALQRGNVIIIDNLMIEYDASLPEGTCASCNSADLSEPIQKRISINPDVCWTNDVEREALLFHELGHCILGREHTTALLPNGSPRSIMTPTDIGVYAPCAYPIDNEECDKTYRRTYYIDELFDESTPVPDWGA